ncbi:glycosyltransferase family 9 protein [Phorcysia thermohydrogeniphila]|uniref:Heptosyltransferase-2/heptosyltransferase-3 n=1 Tax=Phorcysia thermohydrogeniphila TaxID=936138 RepID=A0A4R1GKG5_9BACT|nr:glycosyltransferase family 9 protein [Phorcysia thermohydrogeniphila]TCK06529.1 heptosyltransferase-2/heptosyltransferase-3 [Phorcysia thermohydrogeniphila]
MKTLIIQLHQLGDILLSSALCRAVKEHVKGAEVHFLTSPTGAEIVRNNPYIDSVVVLERGIVPELKTAFRVRKEKYELLIDPQRTGRTKRLSLLSGAKKKVAFKKKGDNFYYDVLVEYKKTGYTVWDRLELLKGAGINVKKKYYPELFLTEEELESGRKVLKKLGLEEKGFFVVVPTSRRMNRAWEPEKFGVLSNFIAKKTGFIPLICYAPGEEEYAEKAFSQLKEGLNLPSPLPIRTFAAVVSFCAFFVGNDSFSSHLSFSLKKKTIVILGPNEGWFPENERILKVKKGLTCQPCNNWKKCKKNLACYRELSPEEAFSQIENWISQSFL